MNFFGIKDLRNDTRSILGVVAREGNAIITDNGKPKVMMISITERDFEDVYALTMRLKAMRSMERLQEQAVPMSMEEIDAEIRAARRKE